MIKVGDRVILPGEVRSVFTSKTKEVKCLVECTIPDGNLRSMVPIKDLVDKIYSEVYAANDFEMRNPRRTREAIEKILKENLRG